MWSDLTHVYKQQQQQQQHLLQNSLGSGSSDYCSPPEYGDAGYNAHVNAAMYHASNLALAPELLPSADSITRATADGVPSMSQMLVEVASPLVYVEPQLSDVSHDGSNATAILQYPSIDYPTYLMYQAINDALVTVQREAMLAAAAANDQNKQNDGTVFTEKNVNSDELQSPAPSSSSDNVQNDNEASPNDTADISKTLHDLLGVTSASSNTCAEDHCGILGLLAGGYLGGDQIIVYGDGCYGFVPATAVAPKPEYSLPVDTATLMQTYAFPSHLTCYCLDASLMGYSSTMVQDYSQSNGAVLHHDNCAARYGRNTADDVTGDEPLVHPSLISCGDAEHSSSGAMEAMESHKQV